MGCFARIISMFLRAAMHVCSFKPTSSVPTAARSSLHAHLRVWKKRWWLISGFGSYIRFIVHLEHGLVHSFFAVERSHSLNRLKGAWGISDGVKVSGHVLQVVQTASHLNICFRPPRAPMTSRERKLVTLHSFGGSTSKVVTFAN